MEKIIKGLNDVVVWFLMLFIKCYGPVSLVVTVLVLVVLYFIVFLIFELPGRLFSRERHYHGRRW